MLDNYPTSLSGRTLLLAEEHALAQLSPLLSALSLSLLVGALCFLGEIRREIGTVLLHETCLHSILLRRQQFTIFLTAGAVNFIAGRRIRLPNMVKPPGPIVGINML